LIFTKCIVYESFKDLISKLGKNSNEAIEYEAKLKIIYCTKNYVEFIPYLEDRISVIEG
jgi:hypothetical protein